MSRELFHHGVKGQQWGVRNGPPYPIEDKVLKKGTRVSNVNTEKYIEDYIKDGKRWLYTYNKSDIWDKNIYEGSFSLYLADHRKRGARQKVYRHDFETSRDLKMPNSNERKKVFNDMLAKNDNNIVKEVENMRKSAKSWIDAGYQMGDAWVKGLDFNKDDLKSKKSVDAGYALFNIMMENNMGYDSTREYSKRMAEKYDAMVDDNNAGVYNFAHDPIIIFKVNEMIDTLDKKQFLGKKHYGTEIKYKEILKNDEKVKEQNYKKTGKYYSAL